MAWLKALCSAVGSAAANAPQAYEQLLTVQDAAPAGPATTAEVPAPAADATAVVRGVRGARGRAGMTTATAAATAEAAGKPISVSERLMGALKEQSHAAAVMADVLLKALATSKASRGLRRGGRRVPTKASSEAALVATLAGRVGQGCKPLLIRFFLPLPPPPFFAGVGRGRLLAGRHRRGRLQGRRRAHGPGGHPPRPHDRGIPGGRCSCGRWRRTRPGCTRGSAGAGRRSGGAAAAARGQRACAAATVAGRGCGWRWVRQQRLGAVGRGAGGDLTTGPGMLMLNLVCAWHGQRGERGGGSWYMVYWRRVMAHWAVARW